MKRELPPEICQLNADIAYVGWSRAKVSAQSGVSRYDLSRILRGWLQHPEKEAKIRKAVPPQKRERIAA